MLGGKPLIQWVWEAARASGAASVIVATDDVRIEAAVKKFGGDCLMTSASHASGTDRCAEVVRVRGLEPDAVVVNVQGDEPLMPPAVIAAVAAAVGAPLSSARAVGAAAGSMGRPVDIATAVAPVETLEQFLDPSCVKALRDADGRALYFSRAPVPWPRDAAPDGRPAAFAGAWRHIGIYGYRVSSLLEFAAWAPTPLELTERLEQLRALEHGMTLHLVALAVAPPGGVDTPADLERVRGILDAVHSQP